jgi:hypothetical protein
MKSNFKKIAISVDEGSKTKFKSNLRLKQRYMRELFKYANQFVTVDDITSLQGNFYETFIKLFLDKYENEFPPISVNKMLEAMEVDREYLDKICKDIDSIDIQLDKELKAQEPDFNIYTESEEQNKLFRTAERICKDVNTLKSDYGIRLIPNALIQGTSQTIVYDWTQQKMKPNTRKVLGKDLMR